MFENLYENIGGKIKNWAKWIFIVEALAAIITGVVFFFEAESDEIYAVYGLLAVVFGPFVAWVSSWILYAFGQLVEDVHAIRDKEGTTVEVHAKRQAEARTKREMEEKARRMEEKVRRELAEKAKSQTENQFVPGELSDDDFIDVACPECGKTLAFLKDEKNGMCWECGAEFTIK